MVLVVLLQIGARSHSRDGDGKHCSHLLQLVQLLEGCLAEEAAVPLKGHAVDDDEGHLLDHLQLHRTSLEGSFEALVQER